MDEDALTRLRVVIGRLSRRLNGSATAEGLTPSQASVLGLVAASVPLGVSELAEIEGVNPTMVSRMVGRLVELGLIVRLPNPDDLRAARVEVTPAGVRVHGRIRAQRAAAMSDGVAELADEQVDRIVDALPALEALEAELRVQG